MKRRKIKASLRRSLLSGVCVTILSSALCASGIGGDDELLEFFESRIRPVLVEHCYECHNSVGKAKADLALDYRDGIRKDGEFGAAVVPGNPARSVLLEAIRHEIPGSEMPSKGPKLSDKVIADIEKWIRDGALDPRAEPPTAEALAAATSWSALLEKRKQWWSFLPIKNPAPPAATGGSEHPIDRFVGARLAEQGLQPAAPADRRTLIRRLSFALTGLPPTIAEIDSFLADTSASAISTAIEERLASPHYGERWARHWMDVVRYADSHGSEGDPAIPGIYQYRDYLIRALNADVPYDQLLREHVAGDLLPDPRISEELGINESAVGTANWRLVFHGFAPTDALDEKVRFTDDQINVFSKAFLGLTVSCARCHNHKFDAISQEDYYALFGVLGSCRPAMLDVNTEERKALHKPELRKQKAQIRSELAKAWLAWLPSLAAELNSPSDAFQEKLTAASKARQAFFVFADVERLMAEGSSFKEAWQKQVAAYASDKQALAEDRAQAGLYDWDLAKNEQLATWFTRGNGLGAHASAAGEFSIAPQGERILAGIYPAGIYTHGLSTRHNGVLASPGFPIAEKADAWLQLVGGGQASVRYVVQYYPRGGTVFPISGINKPDWYWQRFSLDYWVGDRIHLELVTSRDAPIQVGNQDRSWFGVRRVAVRKKGSGAPLNSAWESSAALFDVAAARKPATVADLVDCAVEALRTSIQSWRSASATDEQALFLNAWSQAGLLPLELAELPQLNSRIADYRQLEARIPLPTRVPGISEADAFDQPLLERGNHREPREPVRRRFLEALGGEPYTSAQSGRLELAADLVDPSNPLTPRVIVNRIWHHLFGRGIVATPDNLGKLGELPTHPELLDYLATRMVSHGWSIKDTIRFILGSRTWQQESRASEQAHAIDPDNRWLSHAHVRRLDAEAIRDALVSVAGRMDDRLYGTGFGANSSGTRRSVYITSRRNSLDKFLEAFNSPVPFAPVGRRSTTNVPAQSLALMNDPFVIGLARSWGASVRGNRALDSDEARISHMFTSGLGRPPVANELEALLQYHASFADASSKNRAQRTKLSTELSRHEQLLDALISPARERLLAVKKSGAEKQTGPAPIARWDFREGPQDKVGALDAVLHGNAKLTAAGLVLKGGHAATSPLAQRIGARTLEAWVQLANDGQKGGGVLTIQDLQGNQFDSIVFGERIPRRWMAGSDGFKRTQDFGAPDEREATSTPVHVAITYAADGTIRGYRQGLPYGKPYRKTSLANYAAGQSQLLFGLRHGKPAGGRMLRGTVIEARLYDRALSEQEIAASALGEAFVSRDDVLASLKESDREFVAQTESRLAVLRAELQELGKPVSANDIWTRVAHALFNLKEFIYLR